MSQAGPDGGLSRRITVAAILLTIGTGGTDVVSFTRLGEVFTSVMTANIVLFGLAIVRGSGSLAGHTALSIAGYVLGVGVSVRVMERVRVNADEGSSGWPAAVTVALAAEFVLLAVFAAGWELTGGHPAGTSQYLLQVTAAIAMGMQSAAVRGLGAGDFSTTYLTGQLTGIITALVTPGKSGRPAWRQLGPLLALALGAVLSGILIANAPAAVPVINLAPLSLVLIIAPWAIRRPDSVRC